jgi:pyrroloquinoline quinone biosynthesis protein B
MKSFIFSIIFFQLIFNSFSQYTNNNDYIQVLGVIQDAGFPHIGCEKDCCKDVLPGEYFVSCIGLVDKKNKKRYLFDATPDLHNQLRILESFNSSDNIVDGIFLTHAHIGHYTGLMYLGREGLGGNGINVFAFERMSDFLQNNGPWRQLVDLKNISLNTIENLKPVNLSKNLKVIPIKVPHRDEYSETAGYKIVGKTKKVLFIPDIDKWSEWERDIINEVKQVDYALIDGTFYNGSELDRDMSEIPHPSVEETINLFINEPIKEKNKIYFIHINHTNPILTNKDNINSKIETLGFNVAQKGLKLFLD